MSRAVNPKRMPAMMVLALAALAMIAALTVGAPTRPALPIRVAQAVPPHPAPAPEPTLAIKRVLDVPGIAFGYWVWDEEGVPPGRW